MGSTVFKMVTVLAAMPIKRSASLPPNSTTEMQSASVEQPCTSL